MRIVIISGFPFPIGLSGTNRLLSYTKGLILQGCLVKIIIFCPTESAVQPVNTATEGAYFGVDFIYSGKQTIWPKNKIRKSIEYIKGIIYGWIELYIECSRKKVDCIVLNIDPCVVNLSFCVIAKIMRKKLIFIADEYPKPLRYEKNPSFFRLNTIRWNIKFFDGMVLMTDSLIDYYQRYAKRCTRIHLMPMTVEFERFIGSPSKQPLVGEYIAYIGELAGNKDGVMNLIKSFHMVSHEFPDLKLCIIGDTKDTISFNNLINYVTISNLANRIIFARRLHRDIVPTYLIHAKILALARPNTIRAQGGFPTKLGEYLATGKPVIVTKVGDIPKYLVDGLNAFIVEPDNIDKFAEKLRYILHHYEEAVNVGKEGQKMAATTFCSRLQSEKLYHFLNSIIK